MGDSRQRAACLAGAAFALGACDVLLGLDKYGACAPECDATANEAAAVAPSAGSDALDVLDGASTEDAIHEEAAPVTDSRGVGEDASLDSGAPPPPQVWAQWPMPNPDATVGPDSSRPLPNQMAYDASVDGDVFDTVTGLHWQVDDQPAQDHASAVAVCAAMGPGWRVPARIELASLIDFTSTGGLTIDQASFAKTQGTSYWTSSAVPRDGAPTQWWTVSFATGLVDDSVSAQRVRCVRGGAP
ncbi:MAG: DUF1566 domain-containing protein [Myxococcota bacterium]|nr:DUF1566 domain-containing protein [Myxococcota bacterium]